jgi:hypothetical protein
VVRGEVSVRVSGGFKVGAAVARERAVAAKARRDWMSIVRIVALEVWVL